MGFTTIPATAELTTFPITVVDGSSLYLPEPVKRLSDIVDGEFQKNPDGSIKNRAGKIPGWNGSYLSVSQRFYGTQTIEMRVAPVRVSDDLAAAHYYVKTEDSHENNPISSLGGYVVPIVADSAGLVLLLERRHSSAFLDPGKLNSPGTAFPYDERGNALAILSSRIGKKWSLPVAEKVVPLGLVNDLVNNITLVSGYAVLSERDIPGNCSLIAVPASEFETFVRANGNIECWQPSGLVAVCHALTAAGMAGIGRKPSLYGQIGRAVLSQEYDRLKTQPLEKRTTLEKLGLALPKIF